VTAHTILQLQPSEEDPFFDSTFFQVGFAKDTTRAELNLKNPCEEGLTGNHRPEHGANERRYGPLRHGSAGNTKCSSKSTVC
jgi:hypothetical protein